MSWAIIGGADATVQNLSSRCIRARCSRPIYSFRRQAKCIQVIHSLFAFACARARVYVSRCAYAKCKRFRKTFRYNLIASRGIFSTPALTHRALVQAIVHSEKCGKSFTTEYNEHTVDSRHSESNFLSMALPRSACVSCLFIRQFGSTKVFMFDGIQERF